MELKICHMYPDVLNLYGDGGNIRCLSHRREPDAPAHRGDGPSGRV